MRKIFFTQVMMLLFAEAFSQSIGIGTTQPNASAVLDVQSTTKGLLLPRLTNAQMLAVQSPANSLLVFNTDTNGFWYYKTGSGWKELAFTLPYDETILTSSAALKITNNNTQTNSPVWYTNAASGNAIFGQSGTTYPGVQGYNTGSGFAVRGDNTGTGHGVHARGKNLTGLYADIPTGTGTAAKFVNDNANGLALEVEGKLSITGGNTNPNFGYILTSKDNEGNAVWQVPATHERIAFEARGMAGGGANLMYGNGTYYKYHPANIMYNPGDDFNTIAETPSSTFIVPKAGLYELKAMITFPYVIISSASASIKIQRNGVTSTLAAETDDMGYTSSSSKMYVLTKYTVSVSKTARLLPGDRIWLELDYDKEDGSLSTFDTGNEYHYFSGIMLWAD